MKKNLFILISIDRILRACLLACLQDQIEASFVIFLFLILLAPLIHKCGSSFNAILPSSRTIGILTTSLASFKILLPIPQPH